MIKKRTLHNAKPSGETLAKTHGNHQPGNRSAIWLKSTRGFPIIACPCLVLLKHRERCNPPWRGKRCQVHQNGVPYFYFYLDRTSFPSHLIQTRLCIKQLRQSLESSCCCIQALQIAGLPPQPPPHGLVSVRRRGMPLFREKVMPWRCIYDTHSPCCRA